MRLFSEANKNKTMAIPIIIYERYFLFNQNDNTTRKSLNVN